VERGASVIGDCRGEKLSTSGSAKPRNPDERYGDSHMIDGHMDHCVAGRG
jgi:hypothetical protein